MLPDWKDASAYKYLETLDNHGWAWEFLRRNPEYRKCWQKFQQTRAELIAEHGPSIDWNDPKLKDDPRAWWFEPPRKSGESEDGWRMRCFLAGVDCWDAPAHIGLGRQWLLTELLDPAVPGNGTQTFLRGPIPPVWYAAEDIEPSIPVAATGVLAYVEIDMQCNIKEQLDSARTRLEKMQQQMLAEKYIGRVPETHHHKKNWVRYLRVFDGKCAQESHASIAAVLHPEKPNEYPDRKGDTAVSDDYVTACGFINDKYRQLL